MAETEVYPPLRGRTKSDRQSRVCQAAGARQVCLELLPLASDSEMVEAIFSIGRRADKIAAANDGYLFKSFDEAAAATNENLREE